MDAGRGGGARDLLVSSGDLVDAGRSATGARAGGGSNGDRRDWRARVLSGRAARDCGRAGAARSGARALVSETQTSEAESGGDCEGGSNVESEARVHIRDERGDARGRVLDRYRRVAVGGGAPERGRRAGRVGGRD